MQSTLPELDLERLRPMALPRTLLAPRLKKLADIQARNLDGEGTTKSTIFANRKEDMRLRLKGRRHRGQSFEQATDLVGRTRLLLQIYSEENPESAQTKGWLDPFDEEICASVLGKSSDDWTVSILRHAIRLFFCRFDQLPALKSIGRLIAKRLGAVSVSRPDDPLDIWQRHGARLFSDTGAGFVIESRLRAESLSQLAARFYVPEGSRFRVIVRRLAILQRLERIEMGEVDSAFFEAAKEKHSPVEPARKLGAAALEILIRRAIRENQGRLPDEWGKHISALGCDPRVPRNRSEFREWWSWANESELQVAIRPFVGDDLQTFLDILKSISRDKPDMRRMFPARKQLLEAIHAAGKIIDARLVLASDAYRAVQRKSDGNMHSCASLEDSGDISLICLRMDGFYIVEGTHSFALRLYSRFPVNGFWERTATAYSKTDFMNDNEKAKIPHQGVNWQNNLLMAVRKYFHAEWDDVQSAIES